jgi:hypothetical protein
MQHHYTGDVGDYVKFALLRKLSVGRRLGIAWYLHPDESRDGGHIHYLNDPDRWRHLDWWLFDALRQIVDRERSIHALEAAGIIKANFSGQMLTSAELPARAYGCRTFFILNADEAVKTQASDFCGLWSDRGVCFVD